MNRESIMDRIRKYVILCAVVGLTLISVSAGFRFYHTLFGLVIAILCCVVFETLRLACLWSLVVTGWLAKVVAMPMYVMITMTCAFVAITSFHAEIIASYAQATKLTEQEIARRIGVIKHEYAKKVQNDLSKLDEEIDRCKRKLAFNQTAIYWKNRLEQLTTERQAIVKERDIFLDTMPTEKRKEWIEHHAATLGINFEPLPISLQGSAAMTIAIQELWSLPELAAKKIVSIIIVITTEFGIVLLSLLAKGRGSANTPNGQPILEILRKKFDDTDIQKFMEKSEASFKKHGRLPLSQQLGKKQREIRKIIVENKISGDELGKLFVAIRNGKVPESLKMSI